MDGGIDDALALILALRSPELEVAGVTAVSGNVPVDQAATNTLRVLELLGRNDVWVARGLANPLVRDPTRASDFHGRDGLGDSNLPLPKLKVHDRFALDMISEEVSSSKRNGLTLIATGPLTNIAALLTNNPDLAHQIEDLVIMGGAFGTTEYGYGNETPVAEFNTYSDPEAAKIVFESGVSLKAVGLDVTMDPEVQLTRRDYAKVKAGRTKVSLFASKILSKAMKRWGQFALHDPMAVAVKVKPSLFQFGKYRVVVETRGEYTTGMTVADRRNWLQESKQAGQKITVCEQVRSGEFKSLLLSRLLKQ